MLFAWPKNHPAPFSKKKTAAVSKSRTTTTCKKWYCSSRWTWLPEDQEFGKLGHLITIAPPKSRTPRWNIPLASSSLPNSRLLSHLEGFSDDILQWSPRNYDDIVSLLPWKVSNWHHEALMLSYLASDHVYSVPSMSAMLPRCIAVSWALENEPRKASDESSSFFEPNLIRLQMFLFKWFSCDHNKYSNMFITCFLTFSPSNHIFIFQRPIMKSKHLT